MYLNAVILFYLMYVCDLLLIMQRVDLLIIHSMLVLQQLQLARTESQIRLIFCNMHSKLCSVFSVML